MQMFDPHRWLEDFLTRPGTPAFDSDSFEILLRHALTPYAYTRLLSEHPLKPTLWRAFMEATARHIALRAELQKLFRAWCEAGIEVLLFKGFYLAEFVYDMPGQRFYRDVDLVMEPARTGEASGIAQSCGWEERWHASHPATMLSPYDESYCGHEVLHLCHSVLGTQLDVHRRILHNLHGYLPWAAPQARITETAWQASHRVSWGGAELRVLAPEDSILIGPVLNRCWEADWFLKPQDYLDIKMLVEKFGVTRADLETRARVLDCLRTLKLFLQRCDPFTQHLVLRPPTRTDRRRWNLAVSPERGHSGLLTRLIRLKRWPREMAATIHQLPTACKIVRLLRRGLAPGDIARRVGTRVPASGLLPFREWQELKRSAARALKLLRLTPQEFWPAYVLTVYAGLRRRGCPVELICENGLVIQLSGRRLLPED